MQTIQARVSAKILDKADRLFTNRLSQIFVELLQNARRAGATLVTVTTWPSNNQKTEINFTDNGSGIADFGQFLYLGDSGWDEAIERSEDPAGMGMFSLLHSGVLVRSRGLEANLITDAFLGKVPVEISEIAQGTPESGTTLIFERAATEQEIAHALGSVSLYGSTDVLFNGERLERKDFLADAVYIKEINGVRIGLSPRYDHYQAGNVNFHGNVIPLCATTALTDSFINDEGKLETMQVRVEVVSTSHLRLKLPDRTAIIENDAYHDLVRNIRRTMLEYLATRPRHCAAYSIYQEAQALGIELKEASPFFRPFYVHALEAEGSNGRFGSAPESLCSRLYETGQCVLVDLDGDPSVPIDFTFERGLDSRQLPANLAPVFKEAKYEGYSWYGRLPVAGDFELLIDGQPADDCAVGDDLNIVESIQLSFNLAVPGAENKRISWDLDFAGWGQEYDDACCFFITRKSEWARGQSMHADPFSLLDAAYHVAFHYNSDYEADSWETQSDCFRSQMLRSMTQTLGGPVAFAKIALANALQWDLTSALDKAGLKEVRLVRERDGAWTAKLPKAA